MSEIARMVRLGVLADGRVASAELSALARAAAGAGLGPIWITDRSPTGPLSPDQLRVLTEACEAVGAPVARDCDHTCWAVGGDPPSRLKAPSSQTTPRVVVPAWPQRSLAEVLRSWRGDGGSPAQLVVEVPVSIGRTRAEAVARSDSWFEAFGDPATHGLFGSLEDCQDQLAALGDKGLTELRCILPRADPIDVIAQLSAVGVGLARARGQRDIRSTAPPPPGWGGPPRA